MICGHEQWMIASSTSHPGELFHGVCGADGDALADAWACGLRPPAALCIALAFKGPEDRARADADLLPARRGFSESLRDISGGGGRQNEDQVVVDILIA